jgi:hypothetical protein
MKLTITNAKKIECEMAFPPTAVSARIRVFDVVPPDSGVLVYTPMVVAVETALGVDANALFQLASTLP